MVPTVPVKSFYGASQPLGLLNIFLNLLGLLAYFALYAAHRETPYQPLAGLAALIFFLGVGTFFATNQAFAMLDLSWQYAAATSEAQRAIFLAAGQSMLSVGTSHSLGTFTAFFLAESAGVLISFVMLRAEVFSKAAAYAGMLGFGYLLIYELISSFIPGLSDGAIFLAMLGGLLSMVWYILIARRFFQLNTVG